MLNRLRIERTATLIEVSKHCDDHSVQMRLQNLEDTIAVLESALKFETHLQRGTTVD